MIKFIHYCILLSCWSEQNDKKNDNIEQDTQSIISSESKIGLDKSTKQNSDMTKKSNFTQSSLANTNMNEKSNSHQSSSANAGMIEKSNSAQSAFDHEEKKSSLAHQEKIIRALLIGDIISFNELDEKIQKAIDARISLFSLRQSFPYYSLINDKPNASWYDRLFRTLTSLSIVKERRQRVDQAKMILNSSIDINKVIEILESLPKESISVSALNWIQNAKIWIQAWSSK